MSTAVAEPALAAPAAEDLFARNLALAHALVARCYPPGPGVDPDDLYQVARIGLWRACQTFDPGLGPFGPYAAREIRWYVSRHLKVRRNRPLPQAPLLEGDDGDELDLLAQTPARRDDGADARDAAREFLRRLPRRWRELVASYYGVCGRPQKTIEEIATELGVSRSRVGQLVKKAIRKMRAGREGRVSCGG